MGYLHNLSGCIMAGRKRRNKKHVGSVGAPAPQPAAPLIEDVHPRPATPPILVNPEQTITQPNPAPQGRWARFKEWFKTPLDKLYQDLHAAEKKHERINWELESLNARTAGLQSAAAAATPAAVANLDRHYGQIAARQQEQTRLLAIIDEQHRIIKTYKANRRWYDISKWSTNEKIARLWFAFIYSLLCGISINASINAMEIPVTLSLIGLSLPMSALLGIIGAAITFSVNWSGFWDNVAKLFDEADRSDLKGGYSVLYTLFCTVLIGTTSILTTGLALSTIPGVFGIAASNYTVLFPIFIIFGSTAYALQGLFTQQPRKWFKSFAQFGFQESMIRTAYRLWYGWVDVKEHPFLDRTRAEWPAQETTPGTILHGLARVALFIAFTGITTWAGSMLAPYAAKVSTNILVGMLGVLTGGVTANLNIAGLEFIPPMLSMIFIAGSLCYNTALSGKLAVLSTPFFENVGKATMSAIIEPFKAFDAKYPSINTSPILTFLSIFFVYPLLLCTGTLNIAYKTASFLFQKEISCWSEARDYARVQYYKKNSDYLLPHFIARLLYNHMPVWGAANAMNNGALTAYSKFNGANMNLGELSNKEIIEASTAVASGTTRSYGFFWLTKGDRDHSMEESENSMKLEDIHDKKEEMRHSYFWGKPDVPHADLREDTEGQDYDAYFRSIENRERIEI